MNKHFLLIIYILFGLTSQAQTLRLKYAASSPLEQSILDSISTDQKFQTFNDLRSFNDSVINKLQNTGYINLLISSIKKENDSVFKQQIQLGRPYLISKLEITTNDKRIDSLVEIMLSRKRDKNNIKTKELTTKLEELKSYLSNKGYPFIKINPKKHTLNKTDTLFIRLQIESGTIRRIDSIAVKGYKKFPYRYIENLINKKFLLNDKNINKIKQRLEQMPFVEITKDPELLFQKDKTTLYVYLKKKDNNLVDGLIGFNNNSESGKLELNGFIDLTLNNNLNNGEQLQINYRGDNGEQTKLNLNAQLPYLLKSKIGLSTGLNLLRRDSTYQNTTFTAGLFYSLSPITNTGISYTSTNSTAQEETGINNTYSTQFASITFNHILNSSDDLYVFDEKVTIELGSGTRNTKDSKTNQLRLTAQLLKNLYLSPKSSFQLKLHSNYLKSNDILFNELFQVGGINSIRGFNQNSIDTSFFTSLNTEYRYRISRGIYLHSILDYGVFEDFNSRNTVNIYGIGVGTAILTQSGILRLSIANGAFSSANLDLSSTVAHINLQIKF